MRILFFFIFIVFCIACEPEQSSDFANQQESSPVGEDTEQKFFEDLDRVQNPYLTQFVELKAEISERTAELAFLRNQRSVLKQELGQNIGRGCMHDVALKDIELIVNGNLKPDFDVSQKHSSGSGLPIASEQPVFSITFSNFSGDKTYTISHNEFKYKLFGLNKSKLLSDVPNMKVGDIDYIKVEKSNSGYKVEDPCGGVKDCDMKVFDTQRYLMSELRLKFNGELAYVSPAGFVFGIEIDPLDEEDGKETGRIYQDHIKANEYYTRLMQKETCL